MRVALMLFACVLAIQLSGTAAANPCSGVACANTTIQRLYLASDINNPRVYIRPSDGGQAALNCTGVSGVYLTLKTSHQLFDEIFASLLAATVNDKKVTVRMMHDMPWGKIMMWIFLLSDTFIFSIFLTSYMNVRMSATDPWPYASEVFALTIADQSVPLIMIAIMTFILITSSGTMAMAVNYGYRHNRGRAAALMLITAGFGATFVGMQAFEWTKLIIDEGIRPWSNPLGAAQFGSTFFMITGFHGLHVSAGVAYLTVVALKVWRGDYERAGGYEAVEIAGLYWHFVDLVWVFIFAFFYLW